jgi:ADP-ribose pyrophosphatase YjhB (NUDIX family)
LLRPDGSLLIGHRVKRGEPASWCLPGGHVEPGESFEAAAVREIAEESGVREVADPAVFGIVLHVHADRTHVTAGVRARLAADDAGPGTPEPDKFAEWAWVPPGELPGPLFPATEALIAAWRRGPMPAGWTLYPAVSGTECREGGR